MDAGEAKYYLVEAWALPEVIRRSLEAKRLLSTGTAHSINEAIDMAGISRSAFYKYRNAAAPFVEMSTDRIITLQASLADEPGVLSRLLNTFADCGVSILTINQNIPQGGQATVTISVRTANMAGDIEALMRRARMLDGVNSLGILAGAI